MSIFASILRSVYKLSGAKKAFALPEDALRKEIEKQNQHRGVFTPTDHKAHYETITVNGFPCLIVREHPKPSERAILYFFGGGMVIGPDKGDLPVMRKLCRETGCDVWFPFYPLCMEHCITETYAMVYSGAFLRQAAGSAGGKRDSDHAGLSDYAGGGHYEGACYYRITRCPICIYAEKLGVSELMPLFCELDEVMITLQHGVLHRKQTLANGGEYCDYFITGNRE